MRRSCSLWVAFLCLAGPLLADSIRVVAANPLNAPVRISPIPADAASAGERLRLQFQMSNLSSEFVSRAELTANVHSPDGQFTGFYSFEVNANLRPGESRFFSQSTSLFVPSPGDVVELAPEILRVGARYWTREAQDLRGFFAGAIGDNCDARCTAKDESCFTKCICGVASFSCSCGSGTISYSCTCQRCST